MKELLDITTSDAHTIHTALYYLVTAELKEKGFTPERALLLEAMTKTSEVIDTLKKVKDTQS